jgi:hypothetical protein
MHLELETHTARGTLEVWKEGGSYRDSAGKSQRLNFDVTTHERSRLEFKSGEVLAHPDYAWREKNKGKTLDAYLNIYPRNERDDPPKKSMVLYMDGYKSRDGLDDSSVSIFFEIWLGQVEFDSVREHIIAGHPPKTINIEFESDVVKYGWEPDGSSMIWDNDDTKAIEISVIRFNFEYTKARPSADFWKGPEEMDDFADLPRVAHAMLSKMSALQKASKEILWGLGIFGVLILWRLSK